MNNIRFHIFGVPDGFDIYQEVIDMENKSYYQCFYDESIKEQTRLAINRKPNGDVSYTYLKYHLYSNGNRPNAFIGLSVVFSNGYYADVSSLYNLLEQTYNSILQKGKLLYPIANGSSARFAVNKFSDDPLEIKRIESIVIGTLSTKEYFAEYVPFDASFETGKQNAILKVPFQIYDNENQEKEANLLVVEKLKQFSWLSLSPDYIKKEEPILPGEVPSIKHVELDEELDPVTKAQYINSFENYQSQVLAVFEKLVNKTDENLTTNVKQLDSIVKGILVSLREYGKKQNELKDLLDKYSGLADKLDTLSDKLYELSKKQNSHNKIDEYQQKQDDTENGNNNISERKGGMWQRYLAVAGGAIAVVCIIVFFCKPYLFPDNNAVVNPTSSDVNTTAMGDNSKDSSSKESELSEVNLEELLAKFNEALQNNDFETAIDYYSQVVNEDKNQMRKLDDSLDKKFNTLIGDCAFDLANNLYIELTTIYENADSYINELKSSFKSYVKANKSKVGKKSALIKNIELAKAGEYDYTGIDADLAEIQNLGNTPQAPKVYNLALYYEGSATASKNPNSSEIIEVYLNRQYKIKNLQKESGARFINSIERSYGEDVIKDQGQSIQFKIKNAEIGQEFNLYYKRDNQILFTIKLKVVEERRTGMDLKID